MFRLINQCTILLLLHSYVLYNANHSQWKNCHYKVFLKFAVKFLRLCHLHNIDFINSLYEKISGKLCNRYLICKNQKVSTTYNLHYTVYTNQDKMMNSCLSSIHCNIHSNMIPNHLHTTDHNHRCLDHTH